MGIFGLIDDAVNLADEAFESVGNTIEELIDDPVGKSIEIAVQPVTDGLDVLDGITEGELRHKAVLRLGADVAAGMALSELIEMFGNA